MRSHALPTTTPVDDLLLIRNVIVSHLLIAQATRRLFRRVHHLADVSAREVDSSIALMINVLERDVLWIHLCETGQITSPMSCLSTLSRKYIQ